MKQKIILLTFSLLTILSIFSKSRTPKITVVIVVDQLAYRYIPKIKPYCKGGLKTLLEKGTQFNNAYFPHGMPATATGHATISTGCLAKDHGFIANSWLDLNGNKVSCDDDSTENAGVFNPNGGMYDYGKSAAQLMADSLSDQCILHQDPEKPFKVFALSLKSRAAIACASELGKAIWFDYATGLFTTSKAYYESVPKWLNVFNAHYTQHKPNYITWHPAHPYNQAAYRFSHSDTYQFTHSKSPLIGRKIAITSKNPGGYKGNLKYSLFAQTPYANQLLFDLAHSCIDTHMQKDNDNQMLLWISLSSLDKLGHDYGPDSKESYDMLYHLDRQLGAFMKRLHKQFGKKNVLITFTADHGVSPIIELMQTIGFSNARRFHTPDAINEVNELIHNQFGIHPIINGFKAPQFYINHALLHNHNKNEKDTITHTITDYLRSVPTIKNVWTFDQLHKSCFRYEQPENFLKQQLFKGRSGDIIIQTHPYTMFTKWRKGTDHRSPYAYSLHVPLIFYWPGKIEKKEIRKKVWMPQIAPSLAELIGTQRPSASVAELLPGIAY